MRWLAGKAAELQEWSPYKNNMVLDLVYEVFKRAQDGGNLLLDPDLRVLGSIEDEQPLFREWMEYIFCFDVMSPDGRTRHLQFKLALDEALRPSDPTNVASHQKTVEYLRCNVQLPSTRWKTASWRSQTSSLR